MPRTRLFWHLFVGWCVAVLVTLGAGFWIASVQFAGLSDDALAARLADSARALVATLPGADPSADHEGFRQAAAALERSSGIRCTLAEGDASAAGMVSHSRYDGSTGRRSLEVAVPAGMGLVLAAADATQSDEALARWQRRLLGGCVAVAISAAALGSVVVWRVTKPVDDLVETAERLVAGDTAAEVPATEVAEFAELASALVRLREQLVERGLTIGRQGTQQEAVLGSMIEGVIAIDARQRLLGVNQAAAELLGIDSDRAPGRPLQDVIRNPDLRRFALTAIDCREPVEDDLVLHGLRDRTIRMRGTALRDASGDGGAVLVLNDVTEMQRLERVRRDFVANVSHELKTPIASIKGFVETLLDGALDEPDDARRFLGIVARQADRLAAIIEDLLALSRIEQSEGTGNLPRDVALVAGVLQAAVGDCQPRASDRGVILEVTCPDGLMWRVNAPLLEQAVINLVDNAIKYSDPGGRVRLVAGIEAPGGGEVAIRVEDDGCGISAEHLPRLFERFYRVDKARSRGLGGTGLGLSIVKHIVQAHDGSVAVESEPGSGTRFTIRLPLA